MSKRYKSVVAILETAASVGAAILVLPELTIDDTVLGKIQTWLQYNEHEMQLVAAGSFYTERKTNKKVEFFNTGWLLSARGDILIAHDKLQPMRHQDGSDEGIQAGHALQLLRTERGLVAFAICLDFCEKSTRPVGSLWGEVGPALVLVPSMGEEQTNKDHLKRARELWDQHGTWVLVASQQEDGKSAVGIAYGKFPDNPANLRVKKQAPHLCVQIFLVDIPE
ncbi:MAG: hypothetical protein ACREYE_23090 [Gammaproteobacteria bacterium]